MFRERACVVHQHEQTLVVVSDVAELAEYRHVITCMWDVWNKCTVKRSREQSRGSRSTVEMGSELPEQAYFPLTHPSSKLTKED